MLSFAGALFTPDGLTGQFLLQLGICLCVKVIFAGIFYALSFKRLWFAELVGPSS